MGAFLLLCSRGLRGLSLKGLACGDCKLAWRGFERSLAV